MAALGYSGRDDSIAVIDAELEAMELAVEARLASLTALEVRISYSYSSYHS